jgi:hypothetical protein
MGVVFHSPRAATFSPIFAIRGPTTYVVVADLVAGRLCPVGNWPTASLDDVYAGEDGSLLVVDQEATYVSIAGGPLSKGPRQAVRSAIFARDGGGTRVIVSISEFVSQNRDREELLEITVPDRPRQIRPFGGTFLGQLDNGLIVVARAAGIGNDASRTIYTLALDGTVREIGTVDQARFAAGLTTAPHPQALVAVIRGLTPAGRHADDVVVAVDLASGEQTTFGTIPGVVGSFAARRIHPGYDVVETDGSSQRIVGRDAPSFGPVDGGIGQMAWSPDDTLFTVHTLAGQHVFSDDGTAVLDINLTGQGSLKLAGWLKR